MLDILLQLDLFRQFIQVPVYAHAHITAALGPVEHLGMFTLSSPHHRCQKLKPRPLRKPHDLIHDLIHRLPSDLPAALRTVRNTDPGIQQPEIIINLRHRSHRRTGIPVGRFLVNGNGRRQPFDPLHIRLLHLPQKLPCIRRQGFHISSLPLRIDGVKGKRGLPGPGQPRKHHKLITRNIHVQ